MNLTKVPNSKILLDILLAYRRATNIQKLQRKKNSCLKLFKIVVTTTISAMLQN